MLSAVSGNNIFGATTVLLDYSLMSVVVAVILSSPHTCADVVVICLDTLLNVLRERQQAREMLKHDRCGILRSILPMLSKCIQELKEREHSGNPQDIVARLCLMVGELWEVCRWLHVQTGGDDDDRSTADCVQRALQAELSKDIYAEHNLDKAVRLRLNTASVFCVSAW